MTNFAYMSGTGNDFIVGKYEGEVSEIQIIALVSDAEYEVDGVIFVEPLDNNSVKMHYYNNDGSDAELCVNGGFDFSWEMVFAAANDHVLYTARHLHEPLSVHRSKVTGMEPAIFVDSSSSGPWVVVIADHHGVGPCANLADFTDWEDPVVFR